MNLVARVKGILLTPKKEWAVIDTEPATVGALYTGYIIPLAAIPAVAGFIGMSLIGYGFLGRMPAGSGLTWAVVQYVLALVGVYVLALIIDALAPSFGGQKSQIQALKVSAYSYTAAWVGGVFLLIPTLGVFALILALYSLVLLFFGLPIVMKSPQDKAFGYTAVVIISAIVLYVVIALVMRQFVPFPTLGTLSP